MPFKRARKEIAVTAGFCDLQDRHGRQAVGVAVGLAAFFEVAVFGELFQEAFEVDPRRPLDAESFGDVALGGLGRVVRDPGQNFIFGGDTRHEIAAITRDCPGH